MQDAAEAAVESGRFAAEREPVFEPAARLELYVIGKAEDHSIMPLAELTDSRCYYELHGSGSPVVLIPGLGATCELWSPVVGELAQSFSVILLDNRDIGRSVSKRSPQTLVDFTVDVIELMDHLQLDRAHV